ncbi:cytochrome P450 94B3-like [Oryza brachyantha]|uniref:cytochrome P450 94B3-like n=1 Tax=Oryza brachyantha TaxID=4533 RepID=UPI001AD96630|nr:cytochrome P450 94B3-like [Oryza brachyantha]
MFCFMAWFAAAWSCLVVVLLLSSARFSKTASSSSCGKGGGGWGPRSYPVIGCLVAFYRNRRRLLDWYTEMLAASPTQTIVVDRLGARRTVVTANPANVEHMLRGNFGNYPKGKPFTDVLGDLLGMGIFNVDGELWHAQRKLVSHEFSARALRELEVTVLEAETRDRLVPALAAAAEGEGGVVDMQDVLRRFAFDVICRVSLGVDPGCLDPALPAPRLAAAFDTAAGIIARRGAAPVAAVWKVKRALDAGSERRLREEVGVIHEAVMGLIRSRRKERALLLVNGDHGGDGARRSDLLSRMIECGYPDEAIRDMVISFIMAGRDTTSSALTWFFWLLTRHRDVEQEVLAEIAATRRARGAAAGEGDAEGEGLDLDDYRRMRVLHAALCETMRLYPPVAWDSKHAAADDVLPDGTAVGHGDRVTYFQYGMGRMESIWGPDAADFSLHRWLSLPHDGSAAAPSHAAAFAGVSPFKYPVFQGGPRTCLGKEMAFVQMKFVASAVLRRFELRPVDEGRTPAFLPLMTAHMAGGLNVTVQRRRTTPPPASGGAANGTGPAELTSS